MIIALAPFMIMGVFIALAALIWLFLEEVTTRKRHPRYCGFHAYKFLKPGKVALLDSENCQICHKKSWTLR